MDTCQICGKETNWIEVKTLELCFECAKIIEMGKGPIDKGRFLEKMGDVFKEYLETIDIGYVIQEFLERKGDDKIFIKSEAVNKGFQNIVLGKQYESNLEAILEMMEHYFKRKILTEEMMGRSLFLLKRKQNPFIDKRVVDSMEKIAEKQGYVLAHEVFNIKLKNDK